MRGARPASYVRAPRSSQPFATLDNAIMAMIHLRVGRPCPTLCEISEWTGMPVRTLSRNIWDYLAGMESRGLIEIETAGADVPRCPKRRRMRVAGGQWTGWTARGGCSQVAA